MLGLLRAKLGLCGASECMASIDRGRFGPRRPNQQSIFLLDSGGRIRSIHQCALLRVQTSGSRGPSVELLLKSTSARDWRKQPRRPLLRSFVPPSALIVGRLERRGCSAKQAPKNQKPMYGWGPYINDRLVDRSNHACAAPARFFRSIEPPKAARMIKERTVSNGRFAPSLPFPQMH